MMNKLASLDMSIKKLQDIVTEKTPPSTTSNTQRMSQASNPEEPTTPRASTPNSTNKRGRQPTGQSPNGKKHRRGDSQARAPPHNNDMNIDLTTSQEATPTHTASLFELPGTPDSCDMELLLSSDMDDLAKPGQGADGHPSSC